MEPFPVLLLAFLGTVRDVLACRTSHGRSVVVKGSTASTKGRVAKDSNSHLAEPSVVLLEELDLSSGQRLLPVNSLVLCDIRSRDGVVAGVDKADFLLRASVVDHVFHQALSALTARRHLQDLVSG